MYNRIAGLAKTSVYDVYYLNDEKNYSAIALMQLTKDIYTGVIRNALKLFFLNCAAGLYHT